LGRNLRIEKLPNPAASVLDEKGNHLLLLSPFSYFFIFIFISFKDSFKYEARSIEV
jgi:hypothetical protein